MDEKEVLRRVIQGFELIPAKEGFSQYPYVTKTGKATPDLAKRINVWIKQNFPQSKVRTAFEGTYRTINFYKAMSEQLVLEQVLTKVVEAGRLQTGQRVVRDKILKQVQKIDSEARASSDITRIYSKELVNRLPEIEKQIKAAGYKLSKVVPPGEEEGRSSKFNTFILTSKDDPSSSYQLVISSGEPRGLEHEKTQNLELQTQIQLALKENKGSIEIKINGLEPYTITEGKVISIPGNLPADTTIDNVIFLQLKEEKSQQYSGLISVSRYGATTEEELNEINSFVQDVQKASGGIMTSKKNYKRQVKDSGLAKLSIFGDTSLPHGPKHIQLICRGELKLVKLSQGVYTIQGSSKESILAENDKITESWTPYLYAKYSARHDQKGIKHCRFNFGPSAWIKNAVDPSIY